MPSKNISIVWFRQDLRIDDNPALFEAAKNANILPVYILDDKNSKDWKLGGASRVWLYHSLSSLNESLNNNLVFLSGDPLKLIPELVKLINANSVYWNRCYEPWRIQRDKKLKENLNNLDIKIKSYNGSLLWEPWTVTKLDGSPYKVFSPFYKNGCLSKEDHIRDLYPIDKSINFCKKPLFEQIKTLDELSLLPDVSWHNDIIKNWNIGEKGAQKKIKQVVSRELKNYKKGRDFPSLETTSELSPHIHFGEISPHQIWFELKEANIKNKDDLHHYQSELGWREFSYYLLFHWPTLPKIPFQKKFEKFKWLEDNQGLLSWQKGETGYPIIDAGMRQLWQTGFMHNRVRMIVASFLVKNQLIDWRQGQNWFWDTLFDADLASNSASWQWVAGSGADAAPYFRIFNPLLQSEKFDPDGEYIIKYVPELSSLPNKYRHKPWLAPKDVLDESQFSLGEDYPRPILDLKFTRDRALLALKNLKDSQ